MKRILILGLFSTVLLGGCTKCTRDEVPPPPSVAPESPELNAPPDASPELPADGEPATPAFPDGKQSDDVQDESVD